MQIRFTKKLFNHWHFFKKNDAKESISLNSAHRKRKSNDDKHKTVAESTQIKMVEK